MAVKNSLKAIPVVTANSAALAAGYVLPISATGFPEALVILRIVNASNQNVIISFDGVNDNDVVIAGSFLQIEAQTNAQPNNYMAAFAKSSKIWARGTAGIGTIYVIGYYQPQSN